MKLELRHANELGNVLSRTLRGATIDAIIKDLDAVETNPLLKDYDVDTAFQIAETLKRVRSNKAAKEIPHGLFHTILVKLHLLSDD